LVILSCSRLLQFLSGRFRASYNVCWRQETVPGYLFIATDSAQLA
jgi:hypothetical protein